MHVPIYGSTLSSPCSGPFDQSEHLGCHNIHELKNITELKKKFHPDQSPGQVDFPAGQVISQYSWWNTCNDHFPNGQGSMKVCQLIKKK